MAAGLCGRVAVVTGAAGAAGIGAAICKALAEEGADNLFYLLEGDEPEGCSKSCAARTLSCRI
jgi:NAD(P)-dependent dehydrogenase (short-subunit alcohol dehydrogenase family)